MNDPAAVSFAVRVLRALSIDGRRALAGTEIVMAPHAAAAEIRAGRVRLASDADMPRLIDVLGLRQRPGSRDGNAA
jgi:hypothetical protein